MSRIKKFLITAIALVVVGVVGCLFTYKPVVHADAVHEEKYMEVPVSKVELDADNALITIHPTKEKNAHAVLSGTTEKSRLNFDMHVDEDTLYIDLKHKNRNIFNFDFIVNHITLDVYLPEKEYDSMVISNHNGKIHINHFKTTNLTATTNNGLIDLKNIDSEKVNAKTNNGRITLNNVGGDIQGRTDNGEISVVTKELDRPMDLSCDNGKINITTEKVPTNVRFETHIDNGKINILNKYNGNAVIGNGDNLIKLSTDNGSITVTK